MRAARVGPGARARGGAEKGKGFPRLAVLMTMQAQTNRPPAGVLHSADALLDAGDAFEREASRLLARSRDLRVAAAKAAAAGRASERARQRLLELAERGEPGLGGALETA